MMNYVVGCGDHATCSKSAKSCSK